MKKLVILMAMFVALPTAMATNFEWSINDARGDVSNADIDIVKAWSSRESNNLVLHLQVAGKIDTNNAVYSLYFEDGSHSVGVIYSQGHAIYSGVSSGGINPATNVNGNTLTIIVPYASFTSGLNEATTSFNVVTQSNGEIDYAFSSHENNGGNNVINDPTKEEPTDETIKVKITDVKYSFKKVGNNVMAYTLIKGTTSGVDHVSLCYVTYYKNGTHEYEDWMKGPINVNTNYGGYKINLFFNSTSGQWNTWEFRLNGTYPITDYTWLYGENKADKISKISIYARAFKDKEETKWNQCHYDTRPTLDGNTVSYGMGGMNNNENNGSQNAGKEKSKTPGFEFIAIAMAIVFAMAIRRRR